MILLRTLGYDSVFFPSDRDGNVVGCLTGRKYLDAIERMRIGDSFGIAVKSPMSLWESQRESRLLATRQLQPRV